jgi:hypothetical protein
MMTGELVSLAASMIAWICSMLLTLKGCDPVAILGGVIQQGAHRYQGHVAVLR